MHALRTTAGRLVLVLGLLAWVAGLGMAQLHEVLVQHVVCAEHGEIIEVEGGAEIAVHHAGDQASAPVDEDEHDHGCATAFVDLTATVALHAIAPPVRLDHPVSSLIPTTGAPRGPPLAYAPKTSPPAV